jgi:AcrR family transcriptional regulator
MSGTERREEILEAAVAEFALKGLHGTSTETIAQKVGVSQPYLFHFFPTKKELFLAAVNRGFDRVQEMFGEAAASATTPPAKLEAIGNGYARLLQRRELLLLQMQAYAACSDEEVRQVVRERYSGLYRFIEEEVCADPDILREFFAHGMLMNVAAALDLMSLLGKEAWACDLMAPFS